MTDELGEARNLDSALERARLVVITGDPGSGKSTFLKRMAYHSEPAANPIRVSIAELAEHLTKEDTPEAPVCLIRFLAEKSVKAEWGLAGARRAAAAGRTGRGAGAYLARGAVAVD